MTDNLEELERRYLIRKQGVWYRPNCCGYTESAIQAGRYTLAEAERYTHPNGPDGPRDGMDYVHENDVADPDWIACREAIATAREVEGLRALLVRAYDMLFNSTAASEGDTTTIILERSEWLRLQEKLRRSTLSEKGIHASDATDPGDSEVEGLRAEVARLNKRWAMIDGLRSQEGHSVEIIHDNADYGGPNCAVRTTTDFGVNYAVFYGPTIDDCLEAALEGKGG